MDAYNKKTMLFLLAMALLVCSSFAYSLPQAQMEERRSLAIKVLPRPAHRIDPKVVGRIKQLLGLHDAKTYYEIVMNIGEGSIKVVNACIKKLQCYSTGHGAQRPCGAYCVYEFLVKKSGASYNKCEKYCSVQEVRRALPNLQRCRVYANGSYTCS